MAPLPIFTPPKITARSPIQTQSPIIIGSLEYKGLSFGFIFLWSRFLGSPCALSLINTDFPVRRSLPIIILLQHVIWLSYPNMHLLPIDSSTLPATLKAVNALFFPIKTLSPIDIYCFPAKCKPCSIFEFLPKCLKPLLIYPVYIISNQPLNLQTIL